MLNELFAVYKWDVFFFSSLHSSIIIWDADAAPASAMGRGPNGLRREGGQNDTRLVSACKIARLVEEGGRTMQDLCQSVR